MRRLAVAFVAAVTGLLTGCGGSDPGGETVALYSPAPVPAVPDRTTPVDPAWVQPDGHLLGVADGTYWAQAVGGTAGGADLAIEFDLSQAVFGPACTATFPSDPDACADDYAVVAEPHGTINAQVLGITHVSISGEDQRNYAIDAIELNRLLLGDAPATSAPDGFAYVEFPFVVDVRDGTVVSARQIWTP